MCDQPKKGFFSSFFGGSTPKKTSGEEFFESVGEKIDQNTPKEPYKQGFLNTFIKRKEALLRLYGGDYPDFAYIKKGTKLIRDVNDYVQTDGPSHIKEDGTQIAKEKLRDAIMNADLPDIVEGAKKVKKVSSIAVTTTPEMIEKMTDDSVTMVKQTAKQTVTTIGGGIGFGLLLGQFKKLPMPKSAKLFLIGASLFWTGSGALATGYGLHDLGKATEDQHVTVFRTVMEKHSKRVNIQEE